MQQKYIGKDKVSAIGLGCMGMSHAYGPSDQEENFQVLDRAIELSCNLWDTADFYGSGKNELLLAKALKKYRSKVFLATKFGNVADRSLTSHQDQVQANASWIVDGTPEYVRKSIDKSLLRLGVDFIDLYYLHRVDPLVPIEETVGAMAELVKEGKIRYLGLSEASIDTIRRAMKIHPISALQTEYSIWSRDIEEGILQTCREFGITLVAYSPLGRGFLTGEIKTLDRLSEDDWRRTFPRFQENNLEENLKIVEMLTSIAHTHSATPAQVALSWVLSKGQDVIPIPGTKHVKYLEQNLEAVNIHLSTDEIKEIDSLHVAGHRYPEYIRQFLNS